MGILEKIKTMTIDILERIVAVTITILAFLGTPVAFILGRRQREADAHRTEADAGHFLSAARKTDAETLATITGVYGLVIDDLRERMTELEGELKTLKEDNQKLRGRVTDLEGQVTERDRKISQLERHVSKLEAGK